MEALKGLCTIVLPEASLKEFAFQHAIELNEEYPTKSQRQRPYRPADPQTVSAAMGARRRWPMA